MLLLLSRILLTRVFISSLLDIFSKIKILNFLFHVTCAKCFRILFICFGLGFVNLKNNIFRPVKFQKTKTNRAVLNKLNLKFQRFRVLKLENFKSSMLKMLTPEQKMLMAQMIFNEKEVLFGEFGPDLSKVEKQEKWMEILVKLNSVGANLTDYKVRLRSYLKVSFFVNTNFSSNQSILDTSR